MYYNYNAEYSIVIAAGEGSLFVSDFNHTLVIYCRLSAQQCNVMQHYVMYFI